VGGGRVRLRRVDCAQRPSTTSPPRDDRDNNSGGGGRGCHPSYRPCIPNDRDYDCGELPRSNYAVVGPDEYRLDGDNDGIACES
jgi:hypothetical protein